METPVATAEDLAERIREGDRTAENEFVARFFQRVLLMTRVRMGDERLAMKVATAATWAILSRLRTTDPATHQGALASQVSDDARRVVGGLCAEVGEQSGAITGRPPRRRFPDVEALDFHRAERVRETLDTVRSVDRAVLGMTLVDGMGAVEIAGRLGMRPESVGRRKSRTVKQLRGAVQDQMRTAAMNGG